MSWLNTIPNAIVNVISSIIKIRKSDRIIKPQIIPRKILCFYGCSNCYSIRTSKPSGYNVTFPDTLGWILKVLCARENQQCSRTCRYTTQTKKSSHKQFGWKSEPTSNTRVFFKKTKWHRFVSKSRSPCQSWWNVVDLTQNCAHWCREVQTVGTNMWSGNDQTFETLHMLRLLVYFCVLFRYEQHSVHLVVILGHAQNWRNMMLMWKFGPGIVPPKPTRVNVEAFVERQELSR